MNSFITTLALTFAYRGKGGLFDDLLRPVPDCAAKRFIWNEDDNKASATFTHSLGAIIAALGVTGLAWKAILLAPLWFLFTKPDIGTGFAAVNNDADNTFIKDIHQKRNLTDFTNKFGDYVARALLWMGFSPMTAGTAWMTIRILYVVPFLLVAGVTWGLLGLTLGGLCYTLGGYITRKFGPDPILVSEIILPLLLSIIIWSAHA